MIWRKARHWLIRKLAGDDLVILNAGISGPIDFALNQHMLLSNVTSPSFTEIGPVVQMRGEVEGGAVINWGEAINTAVKDIPPPTEGWEVTRKRRRPGIYDGTYVGVVFENGAFVRFMTDEEYDEKFPEASTDRSAGWEHGEGGEDE